MLVETLGNQAGRTAPWGIRAYGDRGSQKSRATEPRPFHGPVEAQGCLIEDRCIYPRKGRQDSAPRESRIGESADGGWVQQFARRTDYQAKIRRFARRRHGDSSVRIDHDGAEAGKGSARAITFYKRGRCKIDMMGSRLQVSPAAGVQHEKAAFPAGFPPNRNAANNEAAGLRRGFQPTLASAGRFLLDAAAETNASISCMSSEMFPSFSGCHCTPVTHHE
jgi:hypothetical protein